jgi:hypothetical protein
MTCAQFVELVTEYLEDSLDPATGDRFAEHLEGCPGCGPYLDQLRTTIRLLRDLD